MGGSKVYGSLALLYIYPGKSKKTTDYRKSVKANVECLGKTKGLEHTTWKM